MARIEVFDNTLHPDNLTITPNDSSCVFQSSNHFVLKTVDASAKMYLTSTNIFNQLLNQLDFLPELQPGNMEIDGTSWSTVANFPDVFRYTQLLEIDWTNRLEMCNPFLWLKSGNSTVCKLQSRLEFDDLSCSKLVGTLFTKFALPNNFFAEQLSKLDTETVYTVVQETEKLISFEHIDDPEFSCKVNIDKDFHSALANIYSATYHKLYPNEKDNLTDWIDENIYTLN